MGFIEIAGDSFSIPQEFDLINALDEKSETYRVVLGIVDPVEEEEALYSTLFDWLDTKRNDSAIHSIIVFGEGNLRLKMLFSTVSKYTKPYATFYEIESAINDTKIYTERNNAKSKKANGKRKTSNKRISTSSGT